MRKNETMYIFYGEGELLDKIEKSAEKRKERIECSDHREVKKEGLSGFVKDNISEVDVVTFIYLEEEELRAVSSEVKDISPEIKQLALLKEGAEKEDGELSVDSVLVKDDLLCDSLFNTIDHLFLEKKSEDLKKAISKTDGKISIFIHDNPDPDAIASAIALEEVCALEEIEVMTYFGGSVGHPENEILLQNTDFYIKNIDSSSVKEVLETSQKIVFIDFADPSVTNILPEDVEPDIVIDHHYTSKDIRAVEYGEIRNDVGATATIMTKHLQNLDISIDPLLASALLIGIKVDTHDFTKNIYPADHRAISYLSALADKDILDLLKEPAIYPETLDAMGRALTDRKVKDTVLTAYAGELSHRDDLPQIAEYLLRERDILTVLVYGIKDGKIHMSARSKDMQINVGKVMESAYSESGQGGGHRHAAGGTVPLYRFDDEEEAVKKIRKLFIEEVFRT
ncbi:MAG: DHH family phosphoesterase [Candidatus Aenigmatarchaeota archaeon]